MRRALIVGIDDYEGSPLKGCINDANKIFDLIHLNEDGTPNFDCKKMISSEMTITRSNLKENIEILFKDEAEMALLYFSGHGTSNNLGGYIVTQDARKYDEGVSMGDILKLANNSKAKECVIMFDCCFSGHLGNLPDVDNKAFIKEGVSILTASRSDQVAMESGGSGLFTSLVCDALKGGAADLLGVVTTASVYAHVEPIFGAWDQRPLFKTHISKSTVLRRCKPLVDPPVLRNLASIFKTCDYKIQLDKTFEPEEKPKGHPNEKIFAELQIYRAQGLVKPDGEDHLYWAAMNNKTCSLTALGQFYWHLVKAKKI
ncbi:MAG: caspase domain-containing protein [Pseudobdellovibrionaceae bacterium]